MTKLKVNFPSEDFKEKKERGGWITHRNEFLEILCISLKSQGDKFVSFLN